MEKFIELFKETLEIEDGIIESTTEFRDLDEWDSLGFLSVGAMINEEFDITIPREEFEKLITIDELFIFIKNNQ